MGWVAMQCQLGAIKMFSKMRVEYDEKPSEDEATNKQTIII